MCGNACFSPQLSRHIYRAMTQKIAPEVDDLLEARYQGELWIIKRVVIPPWLIPVAFERALIPSEDRYKPELLSPQLWRDTAHCLCYEVFGGHFVHPQIKSVNFDSFLFGG